MRRITISLLSLLLLFNFSYGIKLQHKRGGQGFKLEIDYKRSPIRKPIKLPFGKALFKVKLSKKQYKKIDKIMREYFKKLKLIKRENRKINSLRLSFTENSFNREKYKELIIKQYEKIIDNKIEAMNKIYTLLNDKQKLKLKKYIGYAKK